MNIPYKIDAKNEIIDLIPPIDKCLEAEKLR